MEKRKIDIVFVIDGTGSMTPCIDGVKEAARTFYQQFQEEMILKGSEIELLRIKTIVFRDYKYDPEPIVESPFYEIDADLADFEDNLNRIYATGGGDDAENGLEALHYAFKSEFVAKGPKDRQVIVLFTDADALELKERADCSNYPTDMVDTNGLIREWTSPQQQNSLNPRGKRLVVFAPAGSKYQEYCRSLKGSNFTAVELNTGLHEFSFDSIIKLIAASASAEY